MPQVAMLQHGQLFSAEPTVTTPGSNAMCIARKKRKIANHCSSDLRFSFRDPYRIQTCNLLIRSQTLYSVELMGQFCVSRCFTSELRCKVTTFFCFCNSLRLFFSNFFRAFLISHYLPKHYTINNSAIIHTTKIANAISVGLTRVL